ncbi:hypothetical protein RCL1_007759 [Eukaryota sp. TZLM3-RCL]
MPPNTNSKEHRHVDQATKNFLKTASSAMSSLDAADIPSHVSSVFTEIQGREVFLATNPLASPFLESILRHATPLQLSQFTTIILPKFDQIITDKAGSYFMESLLINLFWYSPIKSAQNQNVDIRHLISTIYSQLIPKARYYIRNRFAASFVRSAMNLVATKLGSQDNVQRILRVKLNGKTPTMMQATVFYEFTGNMSADVADDVISDFRASLLPSCFAFLLATLFLYEIPFSTALKNNQISSIVKTATSLTVTSTFGIQSIQIHSDLLISICNHEIGAFVLFSFLPILPKILINHISDLLVTSFSTLITSSFGRQSIEQFFKVADDRDVLLRALKIIAQNDGQNSALFQGSTLIAKSILTSVDRVTSSPCLQSDDLSDYCGVLTQMAVDFLSSNDDVSVQQLTLISLLMSISFKLRISKPLVKKFKSFLFKKGDDFFSILTSLFPVDNATSSLVISSEMIAFMTVLSKLPYDHCRWFFKGISCLEVTLLRTLACTQGGSTIIGNVINTTKELNRSAYDSMILAFSGCLNSVAIDPRGSWTIEAIFNNINPTEKHHLAQIMLKHEDFLITSRVGKMVWDKLQLNKLKAGHVSWTNATSSVAGMSTRDAVERIFEERKLPKHERREEVGGKRRKGSDHGSKKNR